MTAQIEVLELNGQSVAIVACVSLIDGKRVGYAICNSKAGDKFNIGRGTEIAVGRAQKLSSATIAERLIKIERHAERKQDADWGEKVRMVFAKLASME